MVSPAKELEAAGGARVYPGSLHRHQRSTTATQYRSMLDVEDAPTLRPIAIPPQEPMQEWVSEKLNQAARKHTHTSSDWADILCFYTATNGVAPAAPTRASPAPQSNGKPVSPQQEATPQTVSSTDPKVAAQQASDMRNIVRRKLTGYVGFANLPNQWHRKSVRKGFNFNVMVVGTYNFPYNFHSGLQYQVNLALESQLWLTPYSTHRYTHPVSAKDLAWISFQKPSQFNQ